MGVGFFLAKDRSSSQVIGNVNGELLRRLDLDRALGGYENLALDELIEQKLVAIKARQEGIQVTEKDMRLAERFTTDPREHLAYWLRAQNESFWRKLLLKQLGEKERRRIYELFRDELTRYEISVAFLSGPSAVTAFQEDLKTGATFTSLVQKYSVDPSTKTSGGKFPSLSVGELRNALGPYISEAASLAKPGTVAGPVETPFGTAIFRLDAVENRYEKLLPNIDAIIIAAYLPWERYKLLKEAHVTCTILRRVPKVAGQYQGAVPKDLPGLKRTPVVNTEMPKLMPSETPIPDALPGPDLHGQTPDVFLQPLVPTASATP